MSWASLVGRGALAALLHIVALIVSTAVVPLNLPEGSGAEGALALVALPLVALCETMVLAAFVRLSVVRGIKGLGAITLLYFGTKVLMSQVEVLYFAPAVIPEGVPARLLLSGAVATLLYVPGTYALLGGFKESGEGASAPGLEMKSWGWALPLAALAYVILYWSFGYFVSWRDPAVRAYYGGGELLSFAGHTAHTLRTDPWLFAFQLARGFLWLGILLPAVSLLQPSIRLRALLAGLALAVFMNVQHLYPNPLMPDAVRWLHFWETFPSNFLYGSLAVILAGRPR